MKNTFFLVVIFIASIFLLSNATQAQNDALQILDAMSNKYQKMGAFRATFVSNFTSEAEGVDESFNGTITVKNNKYRLDLGEQEIYNDYKTVWNFAKGIDEVTVTNNDPDEDFNPATIYTMYKKGYKYVSLPDETVNGKKVSVIDLVPENRNSEYFKVRLYVDKTDYSLRQWRLFEKTGRQYTYTIKAFEPNVKVNDSYFRFDKSAYPKVEVVDLR
ncbi:MAG: outer membrane lipoprotein carrier protein LolA [Bernardetiaceae bacterium]|nr:outer membrane lipoprotein carrier protein LolA [Bernardetiaceae bacterium]